MAGQGDEGVRGDRQGPATRSPLMGRQRELAAVVGDIPEWSWATDSPELLLLLLPGMDDDKPTGLLALRDPSLLITTSELSIRSMLCRDRMLPSRSGTGATSSNWGRLGPQLERPAVIGRATGWCERSAERDKPRLLASSSDDVAEACTSSPSSSLLVKGSRS